MTDMISEAADNITSTIESGVDTLKHKEIYYGVAGVAAASITGYLFTTLPFDRIGAAGNLVRTGTLLIGGPAIVAYGKGKDADTRAFTGVTGTIITAVGVAHVLGYFNFPGFATLGGYLRSGGSSFGSEFVAQTHEDGEVTWSGNVFRAVPEVCGEETSAAENFASDFTRPVYAPSMSHQSFMQF